MATSRSKAEERAARAAAALAEQKRLERRRSLVTTLAVVVAMALIVTVGFLVQRSRDTSTEVDAGAAGSSAHSLVVGRDDAPHTVVIYEDFLCPYCGELEKASHEQLGQLAADGQVQLDYRPFVLLDRIGPYSEQALNAMAVVLDASGPEVAKTFHDLLYADQPSEEGPFPDTDWLVQKAVEAGASESDVRDGIENDAQQAWTEAATQEALDAGVQGTPTVLVDGQVVQAGSMDDLAAKIVSLVS